MTSEPMASRFYLIDDDRSSAARSGDPLPFDQAFERAILLSKAGAHVRVFYNDSASQSELSRFANRGIPTSPAKEA